MSIIGQPLSALSSWGGPGIPYPYPIVIPINFQLQVAGPYQQSFIQTGIFVQAENAGIEFIIQFLDQNENPLNISGATSISINFQAPDGTQYLKTAQFLTNGMDGNIYYVSLDTDFVESGLWYVQGSVVVGGATLTTQLGQFEVNGNI